MIYGCVCSGIGSASVAWRPLGWRAAFHSEIEPFPRAVLSQHHGETPLHGDFTTIREGDYDSIQLLVGGTPCQSFSVAGLRKGLDDDRGNLALEFLLLADRLRPRWIVWENVPGVLSSKGGRDFGSFVGALDELGYGFAWRSLDAQFFGLAQRRRRVFVVARLGDWRPPAAVLFERESLSGNPAPRREPGSAVAALTADGVGTSGADDNQSQAGHLIAIGFNGRADPVPGDIVGAFDTDGGTQCVAFGGNNTAGPIRVAPALNANRGCHNPGDFEAGALVVSFKPSHYTRGKDGAPAETFPPLSADADKGDQDPVVLAFSCKDYGGDLGPVSPPLRALNHDGSHANAGGQVAILDGLRVRRITPREAERLQGFPDDYTAVDYRGKPAADGPRYRALGNAMAVPVMRWIGERIQAVDEILGEGAP